MNEDDPLAPVLEQMSGADKLVKYKVDCGIGDHDWESWVTPIGDPGLRMRVCTGCKIAEFEPLYMGVPVPGHLRALMRFSACGDCPIGGQDGSGPVCPRAMLCDWECSIQVDLCDQEHVPVHPDSPFAKAGVKPEQVGPGHLLSSPLVWSSSFVEMPSKYADKKVNPDFFVEVTTCEACGKQFTGKQNDYKGVLVCIDCFDAVTNLYPKKLDSADVVSPSVTDGKKPHTFTFDPDGLWKPLESSLRHHLLASFVTVAKTVLTNSDGPIGKTDGYQILHQCVAAVESLIMPVEWHHPEVQDLYRQACMTILPHCQPAFVAMDLSCEFCSNPFTPFQIDEEGMCPGCAHDYQHGLGGWAGIDENGDHLTTIAVNGEVVAFGPQVDPLCHAGPAGWPVTVGFNGGQATFYNVGSANEAVLDDFAVSVAVNGTWMTVEVVPKTSDAAVDAQPAPKNVPKGQWVKDAPKAFNEFADSFNAFGKAMASSAQKVGTFLDPKAFNPHSAGQATEPNALKFYEDYVYKGPPSYAKKPITVLMSFTTPPSADIIHKLQAWVNSPAINRPSLVSFEYNNYFCLNNMLKLDLEFLVHDESMLPKDSPSPVTWQWIVNWMDPYNHIEGKGDASDKPETKCACCGLYSKAYGPVNVGPTASDLHVCLSCCNIVKGAMAEGIEFTTVNGPNGPSIVPVPATKAEAPDGKYELGLPNELNKYDPQVNFYATTWSKNLGTQDPAPLTVGKVTLTVGKARKQLTETDVLMTLFDDD